jgi:hypothetical protein
VWLSGGIVQLTYVLLLKTLWVIHPVYVEGVVIVNVVFIFLLFFWGMFSNAAACRNIGLRFLIPLGIFQRCCSLQKNRAEVINGVSSCIQAVNKLNYQDLDVLGLVLQPISAQFPSDYSFEATCWVGGCGRNAKIEVE